MCFGFLVCMDYFMSNFMSIAALEIYLLRKMVTSSIFILRAIYEIYTQKIPLPSHSDQKEPILEEHNFYCEKRSVCLVLRASDRAEKSEH